jgi:hypothetical protein
LAPAPSDGSYQRLVEASRNLDSGAFELAGADIRTGNLKGAADHLRSAGERWVGIADIAAPFPNLRTAALAASQALFAAATGLATSIVPSNEDKRYFLERLSEMNAIGEAMGDYLEALADSSAHPAPTP